MAFLVPAVTALVSDVFLLWLGSRAPLDTVFADDHWVYHPGWTIPVAAVRLFLVCVPLLFHSYTGTAVQHIFCYKLFYATTALVLALHVIGLALLNPESLQAIVPFDAVPINYRRRLLEHLHELRRIWWMLGLTCVAVFCHWIVLWHVRSTAPSTATLSSQYPGSNGNKKAPTVYFAVRATSHPQEPALMNAMNGTYRNTVHVDILFVQGQTRFFRRNNHRVSMGMLESRPLTNLLS
jgi:hypothetical protein